MNKSPHLVLEIFGLTIGEITGIGALIASALIFYLGYSRTRKSEQIKITRELVDRMNVKIQEVGEIMAQMGTADSRDASITKALQAVGNVLSEIDYFSYLLNIREIRDENIFRYYIPGFGAGLMTMRDSLKLLDELTKDGDMWRPYLVGTQTSLNKVKNSMNAWLEKYKAGFNFDSFTSHELTR